MSKACPYTPAQLLAVIDRLPLFFAQQRVNDWHRAYGTEAVKEVQAELDRRRAKVKDSAISAAEEESRHYDELDRGYARDRK